MNLQLPTDIKEFPLNKLEFIINDSNKDIGPNLNKTLENIHLSLLEKSQNNMGSHKMDEFQPTRIQKSLNSDLINTIPVLLSHTPHKSSLDDKSSAEELEVDIIPQIDFLTKKKDVIYIYLYSKLIICFRKYLRKTLLNLK